MTSQYTRLRKKQDKRNQRERDRKLLARYGVTSPEGLLGLLRRGKIKIVAA